MNSAKPVLKVAALVSAVLGMGAFVAYRAGAFAKPAPPEAQTPADFYLSPSKSSGVFRPAEAEPQQPAPVVPSDPTFLGGSKSIIIASPPMGTAPKPSTAPPAPNAPNP
jgi:hypothetical protein